jgi:hypothetical protein
MLGLAGVIGVGAIGQAGAERSQAELQKLGDNFLWVEASSLIAPLSSKAIGVAFGFFPAWRASRSDPIAAPHSE